jgi:hypothetical protein
MKKITVIILVSSVLITSISISYFFRHDLGWKKVNQSDTFTEQLEQSPILAECSRSTDRFDGLQTVYACWSQIHVAYELWASQLDGQDPKFITRQEVPEGSGELLLDTLRWSPDNKFIRYEETNLVCPAEKQCISPGDFDLAVTSYRVDIKNGDKIILLQLTSPIYNNTVTSPLIIQGQARGYWFFEATSPIMLTDWDGKIIASHYMEAEGEWMTEDLVSFKGILDFENPSWDADFSKRGTLILYKHNASGLPEHDDAVEITVWFE